MTTRRRRQQRPAPTRPVGESAESRKLLLTTSESRELAADLISELAPLAGDADAVRTVLLAWLEREDVSRLALVCMSAVQTTFSTCLTRVPVDQIPAGALTLTPPPERTP